MTTSGLSCGSCNFCCTFLRVPDIGKPSGTTCWWTTVHGGCQRQAEKPDPEHVRYDDETGMFSLQPGQEGKSLDLLACAQFRCLWLDSQQSADPGLRHQRHMRPDMSHVMLGPQAVEDERLLYVHVDPAHQDAWRSEPIASYLNDILQRGGRIELNIGNIRYELTEPFL
jgi:hypothetical protein